MGLAAAVHYLTLVVDDVLHGQCRRYHLATRSIVIELAAGQWKNLHTQRAQFVVGNLRIRAQSAAKFAVQIVLYDIVAALGTFHQQFDSTVAEQPHTDVCKVEMVLKQIVKCLHRRLLKHTLEHRRRAAVGNKDTMVGGHRRVEPQAIAHHIGIRHGRQLLGGTYIDVATHYHSVDALGRKIHQTLVERQLQVEQCLAESLASFPAEHRYGREYLS